MQEKYWNALQKTLSSWNKFQYGSAVKSIHRLWDTSARKQSWGQASNGNCPLCNMEPESCDHVLQCKKTKKARKIFINEINTVMKGIRTFPLMRRWILIMINQWCGGYDISLPNKNELSLRGIRKAMKSQIRIGVNNFLRGILSHRWDKLQQKYEKKKTGNNPAVYRICDWSRHISKTCLESTVKMWNYRCELVHLNQTGTVDDVLRAKLLTFVLSLQETPWKLRFHDRHLLKRKQSFFAKSKRVTLLAWKDRVDIAMELAEASIAEVGNDLEKYFGRHSKSIVKNDNNVTATTTTWGSVAKLEKCDIVRQNKAEYEASRREKDKNRHFVCDYFLTNNKSSLR